MLRLLVLHSLTLLKTHSHCVRRCSFMSFLLTSRECQPQANYFISLFHFIPLFFLSFHSLLFIRLVRFFLRQLQLVAGSQESVYNVDELEAHLPSSTSSSHWRERRTRRASGDVQVIHVPITSSTSSSGHTASRSSRTRHVLTSSSVGRLPVSPTTSSSESGAGGESTGLPPVTSSINVSISIETRPTLTGTSTTTVSSGHGGKPTTSCSVLSFASSKLSPCSQKSLVLTSPDKVRPLVVAQETKYLPN